jgi:hypothetical protein
LPEEEKEIILSEYKGFVLPAEIEEFMKFFQTDVNVFTFHNNEISYSKRYSYVCSTKSIFSLNVGLLDLPNINMVFGWRMLIVYVISLLVQNVK